MNHIGVHGASVGVLTLLSLVFLCTPETWAEEGGARPAGAAAATAHRIASGRVAPREVAPLASMRQPRDDQRLARFSPPRIPAISRAVPVSSPRPTKWRAPRRESRLSVDVQGERPCWCENRFRITTVRAWFFQSFVPDRSDPTVFGLEVNSAWGFGNWNVANISYLELAEYPVAVPGQPVGNPGGRSGSATGINDLLSAFLFSRKRKHHGPHHFAAGFAMQLPTGTDETLSSGKWSFGPSLEYSYERGRFFAAFVALNVWSVAGDSDRKDVNMFMLKPMITYELGRCWKAVYMPYGVSIYWNKKPEDAVYLPLGGGMQYDFRWGRQQMAASLQLFQNVLRPAKGTAQDLRFMLEFNF